MTSDKDAMTYSTSTAAGTHLTTESLIEAMAKIPPPPFVNPDQCKMCKTILGEKFGGLVKTPAVPLYYASSPIGLNFGGPILAYLCPDCMKYLREHLSAPTPGGGGTKP